MVNQVNIWKKLMIKLIMSFWTIIDSQIREPMLLLFIQN